MPPDATVMLWNRMDDPQHRRVERIEHSTTKSDPTQKLLCSPKGWAFHRSPQLSRPTHSLKADRPA
jgi:hypothetical protein